MKKKKKKKTYKLSYFTWRRNKVTKKRKNNEK